MVDPPFEITDPLAVALVELTFVILSVLISAEVDAMTILPVLTSPFFVVNAPVLLT